MAEIELKTAPADFRFPTTNQTRHCFTRYIEFHSVESSHWMSNETRIASVILIFLRALLLRVKNIVTVISLPSTIVPFALENGSRSGTNRGRMGHFLGLYSVLGHQCLDLLFHHLSEASH
ncbi:uncharacterized protein LOC131005019 isoform X2 [Salvia miltiorrhiza]|uniref:uncharacterized protein LOC131005019 isoform X2 n=1 Tax=Salvia miltiorrhiza TaxID=226208 RepID=UPI0025AD65D1|nr:uncharacterized protein LOC131005019 isoform X2 [Salvia miltiorrhiza]